MKATRTDFYNALKQSVMFSPKAELKCNQLQTFRVAQSGMEMTTPNMGATICDKDKAFFWSRLWQDRKYNPNHVSFEFPLLRVHESNFSVKRPLAATSERVYSFQISVWDKWVEDNDKGRCQGCAGRTIEEIEADTERLLFASLHYLSGLVEATIDTGLPSGYYHKDFLTYLHDRGAISGYTPGIDFGGMLEQDNKSATAYRVEIASAKLYGTAIDIQVCLKNCEATVYNFEQCTDFAVLAQEVGCKDCG